MLERLTQREHPVAAYAPPGRFQADAIYSRREADRAAGVPADRGIAKAGSNRLARALEEAPGHSDGSHGFNGAGKFG